MPRVPTYDAPQVALGGASNARFAAPEANDAAGQQVRTMGDTMQTAGATLAGIAEQQQRIAAEKQLDAEKSVAKYADVSGMAAVDDVLYNKDTGFLNATGQNAINGYEGALSSLRSKFTEITSGIANPRARQMAEQVLNARLEQATEKINRHAALESRRYNDNAADSRAVASLQGAARDFTNDKGFDTALEIARQESLARAKVNGWDATTTQLQFQKYRDGALRDRYDAWSTSDPVAAFTHFQRHTSDLSPGLVDDVGGKLFQRAAPLLAGALNAAGGVGLPAAVASGVQPASDAQTTGGRYPARGLRNNNPGNIVQSGIQWAGQIEGNDPRFVSFATPEAGIAALGKNLLAYQSRHGLDTVQQIIARWAPATENATDAYVAAVAREVGVKPDAQLDLRDAGTLGKLTRAIIRHENGSQPYDKDTIDRGLSAALGQSSLPAAATRAPAMLDAAQVQTGAPLIDDLPPHWKAHVLQLASSQARQAMAGEREALRSRVQDAAAEYMATGAATNPPGEGAFIRAYGQAEGPARYRELQDVAALGQTLQQISSMPATRLAELVKTSKPQPGDGFAQRQRNYETLVKAAEHVSKARTDDPVAFAMGQGAYGIKPFERLDDMNKFCAEFARRAAAAPAIASAYGTPVQLLSTGEAKGMAAMLRASPVEAQKRYLGAMAKSINDPELFKATMQSIAPDSPTVAVAGIYQARGLRTTDSRDVADLILRGQAILTPNRKEDGTGHMGGTSLVKMPEAKLMLPEWNNTTGSAFKGREQAADLFMQTARAIYAARSAETGDYSGILDAGRWRAAIQLATGGIQRHNGAEIVMPYGMAYDKFRDGLQARADALVKAGGVLNATSADLQRLPLENIGDGRYLVRRGAGYLVDKNGRPVVMDFNRAPQ